MFGRKEEPEIAEVLQQRRPSAVEALSHQHRKSVSNRGLTGASALTVRQSIFPIALVTLLFFLWGFAYGLLDVLNAKFQTALSINAAKAGGLQAPVLELISLVPSHTLAGLFANSDTAGLSSLGSVSMVLVR
jgi:FHS family L-fucose permease-like MFS transporter